MSIYTKRGVWYYRIMYQGKVYQGRIGEVPKSVAREIEARKKSDIISGVHIPEKMKRIENITFDQMARDYMEYYKNSRKPMSFERHATSLKALTEVFKGFALTDISPFSIEKYKAKRKNEGLSVASINRELALLKNLFNKAIEWGKFFWRKSCKEGEAVQRRE